MPKRIPPALRETIRTRYLAEPNTPAAQLAEQLGVSRAAIYSAVKGLTGARPRGTKIQNRDDVRRTVNVSLSPDNMSWLRQQPAGASRTVDELISRQRRGAGADVAVGGMIEPI